jgi:Golgi nucleoside diphosphatase
MCACGMQTFGTLLVKHRLAVSDRHVPNPPRHALVIDCGSSGTRIYAYEVALVPYALPALTPVSASAAADFVPRRAPGMIYERIETTPGIANFARNRTALHLALQPLLDWAVVAVPPVAHRHTTVMLCATAGVRKLPHEDQKVCCCSDARACKYCSPASRSCHVVAFEPVPRARHRRMRAAQSS